jgi:hypothetical protein
MHQRARLLWGVVPAVAILAFPTLAAERELDENPAPSSASEIKTPIERVFPEVLERPRLFPWIRQQLQKLPPFLADTQLEARFRTYYLRKDRTIDQKSEAWAMGGLLLTDNPFSFMALLGAMSLAGMMIKNSIVLLDEIKDQAASGKDSYAAILDSAVGRLRPVLLAAATTVLGVAPLLQDIFWVAMAVTIMAGLTFGTVLTMVAVPVLYAVLYRVSPSDA